MANALSAAGAVSDRAYKAPLPLTTGLAAGETAPPIYPGNP